jgi:hypothetical protein
MLMKITSEVSKLTQQYYVSQTFLQLHVQFPCGSESELIIFGIKLTLIFALTLNMLRMFLFGIILSCFRGSVTNNNGF